MVVLSRSRAFLRYLSRYSQKNKEGVRAIQIRATKYKKYMRRENILARAHYTNRIFESKEA